MDISIKYVMLIHKGGFLILQQKFNEEINVYETDKQNKIIFGGLVGGFFTALSCIHNEFKKTNLLSRDSKVSEIWFDTTLCKVLFEDFYKIIVFADCKKSKESIEKVEQFLIRIKNNFNKQYGEKLETWDRNVDQFSDFKYIINEIKEEILI